MNYLLESHNINKLYQVGNGQPESIVSNISLSVEREEFVSLMGPSGSGKSTLLYGLSGMEPISSGSVKFDGMELSALSEQQLANTRLHRMGFIFQQVYFLKNLSIFDNIVLSAYLAKMESPAQIRIKAHQLMLKMQIAELAEHSITQASGGQLQRASICRALINNPDILFGDEPTGALNSTSSQAIMDILIDINRSGTTLFLVTHDVKVASKSERVLYMMDGKIVAECYLGKYQTQNACRREKALSDFLLSMGF